MIRLEQVQFRLASRLLLQPLDLEIPQGEVCGLIGHNGSGKSTLIKLLARQQSATGGRILLDGEDITALTPQQRVHKGMGFVPQTHNIFPTMTVEENLEMGAFSLKDRSHMADDLAMVFDMFPRLKERRNQKAGTLSGGEQQMLAMGRALMSHPKTILMDEPSMGLSPKLVKEIFSIIRKLHEQGITILLVEQNAKMALSIADRAYVLETGRITMEGDAKELLNNEQVRKAYLGA